MPRPPDRIQALSLVAGKLAGRPSIDQRRRAPRARLSDVSSAGAGLATAPYCRLRLGARPASTSVCCGAAERTGRGRTVALLDQSVGFLDSLGLWTGLRPAGRAVARSASHRRHRSVISAASGRVSRRGNRSSTRSGGTSKTTLWRRRSGLHVAQDQASERVAAGVGAYDFGFDAVRARLMGGRVISARLAIRKPAAEFERAARRRARSANPPLSAERLTVHLTHRLPDDFSADGPRRRLMMRAGIGPRLADRTP